MRIALLTNGIFPFQIGGIQKHSYYLAKQLANKGISVTVFCSDTGNSVNLNEYFSINELDHIEFQFFNFPAFFRFPGHYIISSYFFSKMIHEKIQEMNNFDWIYTQGFTSWYFLKNNPYQENVITNLHGLEMFQKSSGLIDFLRKLLLRTPAKQIIKNSNKQVSLGGKLSDILYRQGAKDGSVVELPNGIDDSWVLDESQLSERKDRKNRKRRFIFIGRYERRKGIEEFQMIINDTIDNLTYEVLFIGPIPINKRISHPGVKYMGEIRDSNIIKDSLTSSDVLVSPSYSEGMPTVILEAMARGCSIIATDVGANNTMVDEKNGWLIQGDIEKRLQQTLHKAVEAPDEKLYEMKKISVKRVKKNFTWEKVVDKMLKELRFV